MMTAAELLERIKLVNGELIVVDDEGRNLVRLDEHGVLHFDHCEDEG